MNGNWCSGERDLAVDQIVAALVGYERDHPMAQIDVYRHDVVSVRIRIIDPLFKGLEKSVRHETVWQYLDALPEDAQSEISTLVLLAPDETSKSIANLEFEDPVPSSF